MAAREGDPRPVTIKRNLAIIQGGWSKASHFRSDWVAEIKVVEEREFVALDKADHRLVSWLGNDTSMLSYLSAVRSEKITAMMQDLAVDRNPLGGAAAASPGKRKDLAADLPPTSDIVPVVNGEPITMAILTAWSDKQRLFVELTDANMAALLGDVPEDWHSRSTRETSQVNVRYSPQMKRCFTYYYDRLRGKKRMHTEAVRPQPGGDLDEEIDRMALVCQNWRDAHHEPPEEEREEEEEEEAKSPEA